MAGAPSSRSGMGAVPYSGGVTFRLWAPNATGVGVAGDFNGWAAAGTTLAGEPGGLWSADVPGAVAGQAYQFLITTANATLTRVDPYARQVVSNDTGDAVKAVIYDEAAFSWADESYSSPGWTEMVIYELHVGSFGAAAAGMVGTLGDVAARLPYLRDLGINAVELLPLASFEGSISWGYNPGAPFAVEEAYGGPDGLKAFVQAAHAHGIAVILDVVYNHFGPQDSILWDFDGSGPAWPGGIYFYGGSRAQTPWGSRPDYSRPEVRQYLVDNATAWLQEYPSTASAWTRRPTSATSAATVTRRSTSQMDGDCCSRSMTPSTAASRGRSLSRRTCRATTRSPARRASRARASTPSGMRHSCSGYGPSSNRSRTLTGTWALSRRR